MGYWRRELNATFAQVSDFEYLGKAYKHLVAEVIKDIIDEKGKLREG